MDLIALISNILDISQVKYQTLGFIKKYMDPNFFLASGVKFSVQQDNLLFIKKTFKTFFV